MSTAFHPSRIVRLKSQLLIVAVLFAANGCGSAPDTTQFDKFKKIEGDFLKSVTDAGGTAKKTTVSLGGFPSPGWQVDLVGGNFTDTLIDQMSEFGATEPLLSLNFSKSKLTNAQLAKLDASKALQKCVELDLSETAISDEGLDKVSNAFSLDALNLKGSAATRAAATRLGQRKISNPQTPAPFRKQPTVQI